MTIETWYVVFVVALGSLIRSTFGFGDALFAMPLLTLLVPMNVATPMVAMASATVAFLVTLQDWREIQLTTAWRLVFASCFGIPLGVYLLLQMPAAIAKILLAAVIIGFAGYRLLGPRSRKLTDDRWSFAFGFVAGILGGAYNTQGTPIAIYGVMRGWSAEVFRATLQGFFVPTTLVLLFCHWQAGLWTRQVGINFLLALPFILLTIPLGKYLNRHLGKGRFDRYVNLLLLMIGIFLLASGLLAILVW